MNNQSVKITTMSGRQFDVPILYQFNVYAVTQCCEFLWEDPYISPLSGYSITHVPTGKAIAEFKNKKSARGFCMWMARHFADYDPSNEEHEKMRKALMGEIKAVAYSYRGYILWWNG